MDRRALIGYGTLVAATLLASSHLLGRDHANLAPALAAIETFRISSQATPMPTTDTGPTEDQPAIPVDALTEYLAMRDDADPKARLALIDAWAREVRPGDNIDLLTQAEVDADASVRARAEVLFEREMARR